MKLRENWLNALGFCAACNLVGGGGVDVRERRGSYGGVFEGMGREGWMLVGGTGEQERKEGRKEPHCLTPVIRRACSHGVLSLLMPHANPCSLYR